MGTVLVTGGTGILGRQVVGRLLASGAAVRVASRRPAPAGGTAYEWATTDLYAGTGVDAAVAGVDSIVHCATQSTRPRSEVPATRHLVEAARTAGTPHLIYMSIVGVDRIPLPYYRAKLEAEAVVRDSGLPWTIVRATQFHQLFGVLAESLGRWPIVPVPRGFRSQPIDAGEVADRLVDLVGGPARGRVPDIGGPEVHAVSYLVRACLAADGRRRPVVPVPVPGATGRGYRAGHNLLSGAGTGRVTFAEFLAERGAAARKAA